MTQNKNLIKSKQLLATGEFTCVLCRDDAIYTSSQRGVKPLAAWHESGRDFSGFSAADKVVGKGAAVIYLLLGVRELYAGVMSRSAYKLLCDNGITVEYGTLADNIINRTGDGICPFEAAVLNIDNLQDAYSAIRAKMHILGIEL